MYKVCKPLNQNSSREVYLYQGAYYKPTFYKSYKHMVNDLRCHFLHSKHESVVTHAQVSGNDHYGTWGENPGYYIEPTTPIKKVIYILDDFNKPVNIGLLIQDIEKSKKNGYLMIENNSYQQELRSKQALTSEVPNYFLSQSLRDALIFRAFQNRCFPDFRQGSIPDIRSRGYYWNIFRPIRHFSELRQANAIVSENVLEIEEETGHRIQLKLRSKRTPSNLPNPWDIEPTNSKYGKKSWKAQTKSPKQWGKHKKASQACNNRWGGMQEWIEFVEEDDDLYDLDSWICCFDDDDESFDCPVDNTEQQILELEMWLEEFKALSDDHFQRSNYNSFN